MSSRVVKAARLIKMNYESGRSTDTKQHLAELRLAREAPKSYQLTKLMNLEVAVRVVNAISLGANLGEGSEWSRNVAVLCSLQSEVSDSIQAREQS